MAKHVIKQDPVLDMVNQLYDEALTEVAKLRAELLFIRTLLADEQNVTRQAIIEQINKDFKL